MIVLGYILLFLGFFASIVGDVMFLRVAYQRSLPWFFGCLFGFPIVTLVFLSLHFRRTVVPFLIIVAGTALFLVGMGLADIDFGI